MAVEAPEAPPAGDLPLGGDLPLAGTGASAPSDADRAETRRRGRPFGSLGRWFTAVMPKGLYARSLIIIIAPVVLLQSVVAYVFMERHWQLVTQRLSAAVTSDIAALIDVYETYPQDPNGEILRRIAAERLGLDVEILRDVDLPPVGPKPFFSILDQALSEELRRRVSRPYWIDTVGRSSVVEIRVKLDDGILRVLARRSQAYASNSHIFLLWMSGTSLVLLGIAILFLRNQIRPILRLAEAAESFGKGRDVEFRPRGRGRCGRPATPSSRCDGASSAPSISARPC